MSDLRSAEEIEDAGDTGPLWINPGEWTLLPKDHPFAIKTGAIAVNNVDGVRFRFTTDGRDLVETGKLAAVR